MDNTIEETLSALEEKHLAGRHDQRRHGRAAGSRSTPLSAEDIQSVQAVRSEADEILSSILRGVGDVESLSKEQARAQEHLSVLDEALPGFDEDLNYGPPASETQLGQASTVLGKHNNLSSFQAMPLAAVYMQEPVLMLGQPGSGKTSLAKLLAYMKMPPNVPKTDVKNAVVNCTAKTTTDEAVGFLSSYSLLNARKLKEFEVFEKPYLGFPVRVLDEFNRMPEHIQDGFLPMIENASSGESSMSFHGLPWTIPPGAWLMTVNKPGAGFKGGEGTFPLIPALVDRVGAVVHASGLGASAAETAKRVAADISYLDFVHDDNRITDKDALEQRKAIKAVKVPIDIQNRLDYLLGSTKFVPGVSKDLSRSTRGRAIASSGREQLASHMESLETALPSDTNPSLMLQDDLSNRISQNIIATAMALAHFCGRTAVNLQDLGYAFRLCVADKISINTEAGYIRNRPERVLDSTSIVDKIFRTNMDAYREDRVGSLPADLDIENYPIAKLRVLTPAEISAKYHKLEALQEEATAVYRKTNAPTPPHVMSDVKVLERHKGKWLKLLRKAGVKAKPA